MELRYKPNRVKIIEYRYVKNKHEFCFHFLLSKISNKYIQNPKRGRKI